MARFHINKHGIPAPCHAKEGNCPLGGETGGENHFDTQEEAQMAADQINEAEHSLLPNVNERSPSTVEGYDEDLEARLMSKNVGDRLYAARRGYGAEILADDENKGVKIVLAEKGHAIEKLARDKDPEVRLATLMNNSRQLSESSIEDLSNDDERIIRRYVAKYGKHLDKLANDEAAEVRGEVALNGSNLDMLSNDKSAWVRARVARNGVNLDKFAKDEDSSVRMEVAIQGEHLDELSNDKSADVRKMVAINGHSLTKLQHDEDKYVREAVEYSMNPELYNKTSRENSFNLYRVYSDEVKGVKPVDYQEYAKANKVSVSEASKLIMKDNLEVVNGGSGGYKVEFEEEKPVIYSYGEKVKLDNNGYIHKSVKKPNIGRVNRLIIQYNDSLK